MSEKRQGYSQKFGPIKRKKVEVVDGTFINIINPRSSQGLNKTSTVTKLRSQYDEKFIREWAKNEYGSTYDDPLKRKYITLLMRFRIDRTPCGELARIGITNLLDNLNYPTFPGTENKPTIEYVYREEDNSNLGKRTGLLESNVMNYGTSVQFISSLIISHELVYNVRIHLKTLDGIYGPSGNKNHVNANLHVSLASQVAKNVRMKNFQSMDETKYVALAKTLLGIADAYTKASFDSSYLQMLYFMTICKDTEVRGLNIPGLPSGTTGKIPLVYRYMENRIDRFTDVLIYKHGYIYYTFDLLMNHIVQVLDARLTEAAYSVFVTSFDLRDVGVLSYSEEQEVLSMEKKIYGDVILCNFEKVSKVATNYHIGKIGEYRKEHVHAQLQEVVYEFAKIFLDCTGVRMEDKRVSLFSEILSTLEEIFAVAFRTIKNTVEGYISANQKGSRGLTGKTHIMRLRNDLINDIRTNFSSIVLPKMGRGRLYRSAVTPDTIFGDSIMMMTYNEHDASKDSHPNTDKVFNSVYGAYVRRDKGKEPKTAQTVFSSTGDDDVITPDLENMLNLVDDIEYFDAQDQRQKVSFESFNIDHQISIIERSISVIKGKIKDYEEEESSELLQDSEDSEEDLMNIAGTAGQDKETNLGLLNSQLQKEERLLQHLIGLKRTPTYPPLGAKKSKPHPDILLLTSSMKKLVM